MSWLNITRNIEDYGEEAIGWLVVQNDLWAITTSGSAPDIIARIRKKTNADGSSQAWRATHVGLPVAVEYSITGFAEDMSDLIEEALISSCISCLHKPLDMGQILEIIGDILERKRESM